MGFMTSTIGFANFRAALSALMALPALIVHMAMSPNVTAFHPPLCASDVQVRFL